MGCRGWGLGGDLLERLGLMEAVWGSTVIVEGWCIYEYLVVLIWVAFSGFSGMGCIWGFVIELLAFLVLQRMA